MMVQPVRLPDIEHIHVSMNLSTSAGKNVSLWYPDGSVALELREQISRQVQVTVKNVNVDHDDVKIRDLKRKQKKKDEKKRNVKQ